MKKKETIFCITGLSGTGKTTLYNYINKRMNRKPVVQYTSRPKRQGEIDTVHYNFISEEELTANVLMGRITCFERYNISDEVTWCYGYMKKDLYNGCILVMNPKSIKSLKEEGTYNVVSINLYTSEIVRLYRIFKRKDNQGIKEIIRRTRQDKKTFKKHKFDYYVKNNNIEETYKQILKIIINVYSIEVS